MMSTDWGIVGGTDPGETRRPRTTANYGCEKTCTWYLQMRASLGSDDFEIVRRVMRLEEWVRYLD